MEHLSIWSHLFIHEFISTLPKYKCTNFLETIEFSICASTDHIKHTIKCFFNLTTREKLKQYYWDPRSGNIFKGINTYLDHKGRMGKISWVWVFTIPIISWKTNDPTSIKSVHLYKKSDINLYIIVKTTGNSFMLYATYNIQNSTN